MSLLALLLCLLHQLCPHGAPHACAPSTPAQVRATLIAQAVAWDAAIVRKDRSRIEANMAEGFVHIGESGALNDTRGFLSSVLDQRLEITPYTMAQLEVRVFGDFAFLTGTTRLSGRWQGQPFSTHYRFTDTYRRHRCVWKVVRVQITPISDP
jgi:ketosteroid isomerase-like protein